MATAAKSTASTIRAQAIRARSAQRKKITRLAKGKTLSGPRPRRLRIRA